MMLMKVFGIWILLSNITYLEPGGDRACRIHFAGDKFQYLDIEKKSCDEVAAEIRKNLS